MKEVVRHRERHVEDGRDMFGEFPAAMLVEAVGQGVGDLFQFASQIDLLAQKSGIRGQRVFDRRSGFFTVDTVVVAIHRTRLHSSQSVSDNLPRLQRPPIYQGDPI